MSGKYESIFFVFTSFFRGSRFTSIIFLCNFHCPVYTFIAFFYAHFVLSDNCFAWNQVGELHPRRSNKKRARPIDYCYTVVVFFLFSYTSFISIIRHSIFSGETKNLYNQCKCYYIRLYCKQWRGQVFWTRYFAVFFCSFAHHLWTCVAFRDSIRTNFFVL